MESTSQRVLYFESCRQLITSWLCSLHAEKYKTDRFDMNNNHACPLNTYKPLHDYRIDNLPGQLISIQETENATHNLTENP